jgi:glyoxylase-like metal-dependent hydrolase (beta-lactamase superfamily II)
MLRATEFGEVVRFDLARTLAGQGRYWTSAYLVGDVLIDSGCAHARRELLELLSDRRLRAILNTHSHEDHIGANGALQRRRPGLDILVHRNGVEVLADPRGRQPLHPYRRVMWGWPEPSTAIPLDDGETVELGSYRFEAVHTPGHADDHLCLFEPDRGWLFTGDLFVGGQERALRADYDIWGIIASLKKISGLPSTIMFPGSAQVRERPGPEIAAKIDYLEGLGVRILERHRGGASVARIVRELCGPPLLLEAITLGHFSRHALVRSFLAGSRP